MLKSLIQNAVMSSTAQRHRVWNRLVASGARRMPDRLKQDLSDIMELRFAVEVVATQLAALRREDAALIAMESSLEDVVVAT